MFITYKTDLYFFQVENFLCLFIVFPSSRVFFELNSKQYPNLFHKKLGRKTVKNFRMRFRFSSIYYAIPETINEKDEDVIEFLKSYLERDVKFIRKQEYELKLVSYNDSENCNK